MASYWVLSAYLLYQLFKVWPSQMNWQPWGIAPVSILVYVVQSQWSPKQEWCQTVGLPFDCQVNVEPHLRSDLRNWQNAFNVLFHPLHVFEFSGNEDEVSLVFFAHFDIFILFRFIVLRLDEEPVNKAEEGGNTSPRSDIDNILPDLRENSRWWDWITQVKGYKILSLTWNHYLLVIFMKK